GADGCMHRALNLYLALIGGPLLGECFNGVHIQTHA
ncbi:hypothetical protein PSYJA_46321, partial [Pseudomonas syringae pv. japonica str. M301072]